MTTKELRQGNLLLFNPKDRLKTFKPRAVEVLEIRSRNIITSDLGLKLGVFLDDVEGIQLTPEILEQVEFIKKKAWGTPSFRKHDIILNQPTDKEFSFGYYREAGRMGTTAIAVQFVHELQNLYFFLTGEELDLTNFKL